MKALVAGIDGCRGGWFVVTAERHDGLRVLDAKVVPIFSEAVDFASSASDIAVDIPIGLNERSGRAIDLLARRVLGPRWMCVFEAPPRPVLAAKSHAEANRLHRELTGKGLSRQAFAIMEKIDEVDRYLRARPGSADRVWEVHPETCFTALSHGAPLLAAKTSKEGLRARRALLRPHVPGLDAAVAEALGAWPRKVLKEDDLLDAVVACVTAATWRPESTIVAAGEERDACGLPMQMRRPGTYSFSPGHPQGRVDLVGGTTGALLSKPLPWRLPG